MLFMLGILDIRGDMTSNATYRWLASWCRDYLDKYLNRTVNALIKMQEKKLR